MLEAHDPPMQALMLRSSILGRLCGPLCDVVLEQQHSAEMLGELSRAACSWSRSAAGPGGTASPGLRPAAAGGARTARARRRPGPASSRVPLASRSRDRRRGDGSRDGSRGVAAAARLVEAIGQLRDSCGYRTVLAWLGDSLPRDPRRRRPAAPGRSVGSFPGRQARGTGAGRRGGGTAGRDRNGPAAGRFSSVEASLGNLRAAVP